VYNLKWIDGVTKDAEKLGVRNWRARTRDKRWLEAASWVGQHPAWFVAPGSQWVILLYIKVH